MGHDSKSMTKGRTWDPQVASDFQEVRKHVVNVAISFWCIIVWELYCKVSCWCKRNTVGNGVDCASNKVLMRGEVFLFVPSLIANQVIGQVSGQFADVAPLTVDLLHHQKSFAVPVV